MSFSFLAVGDSAHEARYNHIHVSVLKLWLQFQLVLLLMLVQGLR